MRTNIRKIAEVLADEIIEAERQMAAQVQQETDLYWARFLRSQGYTHLWRKGIIARGMLLEKSCNSLSHGAGVKGAASTAPTAGRSLAKPGGE